MNHQDAFYRAFCEEVEELQKEGAVFAAIPAVLGGIAKGVGTAAMTTGRLGMGAARLGGRGIMGAGRLGKRGIMAAGRGIRTGAQRLRAARAPKPRTTPAPPRPKMGGGTGITTPQPEQRRKKTLWQDVKQKASDYAPYAFMGGGGGPKPTPAHEKTYT